MKRDWEVVRLLLIELEKEESLSGHLMPGGIKGYDPQLVSYHIKLIGEAGLAEVSCHQALGVEPFYIAHSLTWQGHEFLDSIRESGLWNRIKASARQKGIEMSMETIRLIASSVLKQIIGG